MRPIRIVSLIPSTTELLCRLGLADALVGITVYCREPADLLRGKPHIGGEKNPDLERIRALAPDLVIANVEENARRPDVILLPDEPFRFRPVHLADFTPYPDVPAVREGRIYLVDGKPFSWHGPRLADALQTLPALFGRAAGNELRLTDPGETCRA